MSSDQESKENYESEENSYVASSQETKNYSEGGIKYTEEDRKYSEENSESKEDRQEDRSNYRYTFANLV